MRHVIGWAALVAVAWVFWPRVPDRVTPKVALVLVGLIAVAVWGLV